MLVLFPKLLFLSSACRQLLPVVVLPSSCVDQRGLHRSRFCCVSARSWTEGTERLSNPLDADHDHLVLLGNSNHYSKMMALTDELGNPIFENISINLVCEECRMPTRFDTHDRRLCADRACCGRKVGAPRVVYASVFDLSHLLCLHPLLRVGKHKLGSLPRWISSAKVEVVRYVGYHTHTTRRVQPILPFHRTLLADDPVSQTSLLYQQWRSRQPLPTGVGYGTS